MSQVLLGNANTSVMNDQLCSSALDLNRDFDKTSSISIGKRVINEADDDLDEARSIPPNSSRL
jgi:hypothetical protein